RFNVGLGAGQSGSVVLDGGFVHVGSGDGATAPYLNVGDGGTGTFTQVAGTVVLDNSAFQIGANGGTGEYNLNGGTVDLINQSTIYIGRSGGEGTLHVTGDAKFTFNGQAFIGYEPGGGTGK